MPTQKQRQERLEILAEKWKTNEENGCSEVLNRKLCDDMMKQVWFLLSSRPHNLATFILVSIANAKIKNNNAGVRYSIIC